MKTENAPQSSECYYNSDDLRMFEETTDDILAALVRAENYPIEPGVTKVLRLQIAAALFECANECTDEGELDRGALKRRVLAQFHTGHRAHRSGAFSETAE